MNKILKSINSKVKVNLNHFAFGRWWQANSYLLLRQRKQNKPIKFKSCLQDVNINVVVQVQHDFELVQFILIQCNISCTATSYLELVQTSLFVSNHV